MGPYSEEKQMERALAVQRILSDPNLNEWSRNYWTKVAMTLSLNEEQYNARVKNTYQNMIQWRNPFDE
jgi:hypothetical protein